ncbi:MAG: branched-chain amino acid transport system substrate-binding protein [Thermosediminibacterales bacterium]|nr:branched-chain amino acid transport system substrate-binding protein [Thermosediminibacterales bacterium]
MKKILVYLVVFALISTFAVGCSSGGGGGAEKESKPEVVKIGVLFPFSGSMAALGEENFRGAEIARLVRNKQGGLWGKQIEFVKADAPDATAAVAEADRLINKEGMKVIIGSYSSSLSYAASEVAERNGVIYWEVGGISDPITSRGYKYLFRTVPTGSSFGIQAVKFAKAIAPDIGVKPEEMKIAIVHEDSMYGTTVGENAKAEVERQGLDLVEMVAYSAKTNDLSSVILKLKAANPDVLIATSYITDTILFWRQARELNFYVKAAIGTGAGYAMRDFAEAVGDDVNRIFNVDFPQLDTNPEFAKGIDEFKKLYEETFGEPPKSGHSLVSYAGALILWDVMEKAGSMDPEAIRKAALEVDIPDGETAVGFGCKFAGPDAENAGQNIKAYPLVAQWKNQKLVTVWPEEAAAGEIELPMKPWE